MSTLASILQSQASAPMQGCSILAATLVGGPLMWIRYEGATDSGATIAASAGGDMTFTTDGTTADTTVNTTGTIDMSTPPAASNTVGKVVDLINDGGNWSCVLLGGLRAGLTDACVLTVTEVDMSTAAMKATGYYVYQDGAAALATSLYGVPWCISGFDPSSFVRLTAGALTDPDYNCQSVCTFVNALSDFSAAGYIEFISCSQAVDGVGFQVPLVDNTIKEIGNLAAPIFRSKMGDRLVIRAINDQDAVANATRLDAAGYTVNVRSDILPGFSLTNAAG